MIKKNLTKSEILTKQMRKIYDEHHDPEKKEERRRKRIREKRRETKIKDYGF